MEHAITPLRYALLRLELAVNANHRRIATIAIILTGLVVAAVLGYPDFIQAVTHAPPVEDPGIPASFSGNRLAFGFALFSLFSVSSLAIRQLFLIAAQLRREGWRSDPDVGLYRMTVGALMMAIVLGAAPDVILLLIYGEANEQSMTAVMTIDRVCDGLVGVPFVAAVFLRVRAEQFQRSPTLDDLHALNGVDVGPRDRALFLVQPQTESIAENVKIVLFIMAIAAGLALLK